MNICINQFSIFLFGFIIIGLIKIWDGLFILLFCFVWHCYLLLCLPKTQAQNVELEHEVEKVMKEFKQDPVQQKMHVRKIFKKEKFVLCKELLLLSTALVLILFCKCLSVVLVDAICDYLYPSVEIPGHIIPILWI
jgi:hypothetical protein